MTTGTLNVARLSPKLAVLRLRLQVVAGPDAGAFYEADADRATVGTAEGNHLRLSDPTVSRFHAKLVASEGGVLVVDCGSTNGTRLGSASLQRAVVDAGAILTLGHTHIQIGEGERGAVDLHPEDTLGALRGRSQAMRRLMAQLGRLAASDVAALLVGESGTGKELIARALHDGSGRREGPFVTVDCGALAPGLVASELFGHERGAFTGADRRREGAFERAHGGTLFLDEIGELPADLQSHLLGVLERRRLRRVGGSEEIGFDVRVVSATNRDLRAEVNDGTFRLDLYYRLAVVCVEVPPLRERSDDVPLLVEHFLRECGYEGPIEGVFAPERMARLEAYGWPGNVRELRNVVEATLVTGEPVELSAVEDRPPRSRGLGPPRPEPKGLPLELDRPYEEARARLLDEFERRYLTRLIERAGGNVSQAAREARMTRSHMYELLHKHNLR